VPACCGSDDIANATNFPPDALSEFHNERHVCFEELRINPSVRMNPWQLEEQSSDYLLKGSEGHFGNMRDKLRKDMSIVYVDLFRRQIPERMGFDDRQRLITVIVRPSSRLRPTPNDGHLILD
jgi:hypothetical protein